MSYWVVGGVYKNTEFKEIVEGSKLEKFGPFQSYDDAKKIWSKVSWANVDDCNTRFVIRPQK